MTRPSGYLKIAKIGNVPIFAHWSFPVGGILVAILGHMDPRQWIYYIFSYTFLIIIHEAGHAIAAVLFGLKVFAIEISGIGGLCRNERPRRVWHCVFLYSAGLVAQSVLFLFTLAYASVFGVPESEFGKAIVITFVYVNAAFFIMNLIPSKGFRRFGTDGYVLWRLLLHVLLGHRHPVPSLVPVPAEQSPVFPAETRLLSKAVFRPHGFVHGIEILNDRTTPMEFVVDVLCLYLGISRNEAAVKMLEIHNTGGLLISFPSAQEARNVANNIAVAAYAAGYSFVCRYISTQRDRA